MFRMISGYCLSSSLLRSSSSELEELKVLLMISSWSVTVSLKFDWWRTNATFLGSETWTLMICESLMIWESFLTTDPLDSLSASSMISLGVYFSSVVWYFD